MPSTKTQTICFVLGAGASQPYGYPLGEELAQRVIQLARAGNSSWAKEEELAQVNAWAHQMAAKFEARRRSQPRLTIDAFLEVEYPNVEARADSKCTDWNEYSVAKMIIAQIIREHEDPFAADGNWYRMLYQSMKAFQRDRNIHVITFNYDRSLEYYLAKHRARDMGLTPSMARLWQQSIAPIIHIYGTVGPLPDGTPKRDNFAPEYGETKAGSWPFWKGRETISLIRTGAIGPTQEDQAATELLAAANAIVILGFGFDKVNFERIGLNRHLSGKSVFSTAFIDADKKRIEELTGSYAATIGKTGEGCQEFLNRIGILTS